MNEFQIVLVAVPVISFVALALAGGVVMAMAFVANKFDVV